MLLAVLAPCFIRGGYTGASRALAAALAGAALLAAVASAEDAVRRLARTLPVVVLFILCALCALSATWSVSEPGDALRLGFTVAGYGALAVAAGALATRKDGLGTCARILVGVAASTALAGIVGVALHQEPWAERIVRQWRPGGPFEYPPALALAQVAAAPAYLFAMVRATRRWAALAAAGAALGAAVITLAGSRIGLAGAELILLTAMAWPEATLGARRPPVVAAAIVLLAAGAGAWAVGRLAGDGEDYARVIGLLLVVASAAATWALLRPVVERLREPRIPKRALLVVLAMATVSAIAVATVSGEGGLALGSGIGHGRTELWRAAAYTASDHPVLGAGAGAFLPASVMHQGQSSIKYAHNLPLELAAELGIAGALLAIALYVGVGRTIPRAMRRPGSFLVVPFAGLFLLANLLDWEWHLAGVGAIWAVSLGATVCAAADRQPGPG